MEGRFLLCNINKTQEKQLLVKFFESDTAFRFPYFMPLYSVTLTIIIHSRK